MRPVLVLTGGPAVGKSTTAVALARERARAAVVEVDDIRQLVLTGGAAPWDGSEGRAQQRLGALNACALATNFSNNGFDVVVTDVLTPETALLYRQAAPSCTIVRLYVDRAEAHRRARTRRFYLSDAEFEDLHRQDESDPPAADHHVDVTALTPDAKLGAVRALWRPDGS
jgi:predicted kinase